MSNSFTGGLIAVSLLILTGMLVTGPMGLNMWNAVSSPSATNGPSTNVETCPESTATYTFRAYNNLARTTSATARFVIQKWSPTSNMWYDVNDTANVDYSTGPSASLSVGSKYRWVILQDNGSTNDYYAKVIPIDSAVCGGDILSTYLDREGDLELKWIESDQTLPDDAVTNAINDGVIVKGVGQDFHVTLQLEENKSDAVFGDGVTPIAIGLAYNTSSYDEVSIAGWDCDATVPNYMPSDVEKFCISNINQIGEFETEQVTVVGDLNDNAGDPDGVNFNITAYVVDGDAYFHSTTDELLRGYENNTNGNIGITIDPQETLVVK